jgi:hypothetical protein
MEICDNGHDPIAFESYNHLAHREVKCPLCKLIEERDALQVQLDEAIDQVDGLKDDIAELKAEQNEGN